MPLGGPKSEVQLVTEDAGLTLNLEPGPRFGFKAVGNRSSKVEDFEGRHFFPSVVVEKR